MNEPSEHYLGDAGQRYFAERFTAAQDFGRRYQSRYFLPWCGPDKTVLDFGCGNGTIIRNLPARRKLAVEVNPHCVQVIQAENAGAGTPVTVSPDLAAVPGAVADVVISNHSLEHVPAPLETLREIHRVLVPGGVLVLVTPFDDWRQAGWDRWSPGDRQNHLYTWTPMNIGNLLREAGFQVERSELRSTAWSPRFFWVHRWLGEGAFALACRLFAAAVNRREVLSVARRPGAA